MSKGLVIRLIKGVTKQINVLWNNFKLMLYLLSVYLIKNHLTPLNQIQLVSNISTINLKYMTCFRIEQNHQIFWIYLLEIWNKIKLNLIINDALVMKALIMGNSLESHLTKILSSYKDNIIIYPKPINLSTDLGM